MYLKKQVTNLLIQSFIYECINRQLENDDINYVIYFEILQYSTILVTKASSKIRIWNHFEF